MDETGFCRHATQHTTASEQQSYLQQNCTTRTLTFVLIPPHRGTSDDTICDTPISCVWFNDSKIIHATTTLTRKCIVTSHMTPSSDTRYPLTLIATRLLKNFTNFTETEG
jgi:hypothetical protein